MADQEKKIRILKDGPYLVSGNVPLDLEKMVPDQEGNPYKFEKAKTYEAGETYALCRCGHTKGRPFCDGTHKDIGFTAQTGKHKCYNDEAEVFRGGTIELLDQEELCIGARFCDRLGRTWNLAVASSNEHPEYEKAATEEACLCPAGRLTVRKDGKEIEFAYPQEIALLEDEYHSLKGPIFVKGGIPLIDENGEEYEKRNRRTLCRCGESGNMPFCDASHFYCKHMQGSDV